MMTEDDIKSLLPECLLRSETYYLVITDLEGRYVFVNNAFKERFSFICENFVGQPSLIAIYPKDHQVCLQAVEQCFANPDKVVKVHLRTPDTNQQDFYWTEWEFSLFKDQYKNPIGILCIGHDITETERANKQAKELAQKVETIIEEITDGFYLLDRDWKFVKINKVSEQILGITREQLLGRKIWDLFPDTPDYNYSAAYRNAIAENKSITFEDYRPDLDKWFSAVCYPSTEGLTVFFRDITQEKKYIETIKQQEYILRAIYQSTSEASTFIDKNFIIRYNNKVAQSITRQVFGKEAQIGDSSLDYVLPEYQAEFKDFYTKALSGQNIIVERTDGINWWQLSMYPVYDEQQQIIGIAHNVQNITERKNRELKILQQNETLRAISWQQSHEVRRPVANILGLCDLLKNYKNETEEMKNKYIESILSATQELDKIIHKIVYQANESEYLDKWQTNAY
ncbi:PAS domain-containing protein [Thermoflexibacter ruber]|uniref:histidine kinase n=1 Tax=Thermoflexibacter ruber TaxID=1003 RepID=A0A1I2ILZ5_9BACT|nr:PAS domain-containing protein [Thermoflexibacter ruber]SFF43432.1 PAS domain S-box-containing protein [Thermoflexibacter ruber]